MEGKAGGGDIQRARGGCPPVSGRRGSASTRRTRGRHPFTWLQWCIVAVGCGSNGPRLPTGWTVNEIPSTPGRHRPPLGCRMRRRGHPPASREPATKRTPLRNRTWERRRGIRRGGAACVGTKHRRLRVRPVARAPCRSAVRQARLPVAGGHGVPSRAASAVVDGEVGRAANVQFHRCSEFRACVCSCQR